MPQPNADPGVRGGVKFNREDYGNNSYLAYNPLTGQYGYIAENGAQGSVVNGIRASGPMKPASTARSAGTGYPGIERRECRCRRHRAGQCNALSSQHAPIARNDLRIKACAGLQRAFLAREVDMDDAEALGKAVRLFEVVEQRPDHVATHVAALPDRGLNRAQMLAAVGLFTAG